MDTADMNAPQAVVAITFILAVTSYYILKLRASVGRTEELCVLGELHVQGLLTREEFEARKKKLLR